MVVSAPYADIGANQDQGAAYVFVRIGGVWTQDAKLVAGDASASAYFGANVDVDNNKIVVAFGPNNPVSGLAAGGVHMFNHAGSSWVQQAKVLEDDGTTTCGGLNKTFALSGNTFVCGFATWFGTRNLGVAYVFTVNGSTWTRQSIYGDADLNSNNFGGSVAISGDTLAIGAPALNIGLGAAFVFARTNNIWIRQQRIDPPASTGGYGSSIAIDGNTLVTGAGAAGIEVADVYVNPFQLQMPFFAVSDADGNNNGFPEPGENLTLTVSLSNNSGVDVTGTTAQVVGGSMGNYGTIAGQATVTRQMSFTVPRNISCGSTFRVPHSRTSSRRAEFSLAETLLPTATGPSRWAQMESTTLSPADVPGPEIPMVHNYYRSASGFHRRQECSFPVAFRR